MDLSDITQRAASNNEVTDWEHASSQVIARALNSALGAQDIAGFASLLFEIAEDRGLVGVDGTHLSTSNAPYASLLPREKHLLADAFDLFLHLDLVFKVSGGDIEG
ncbi:hypothetical protein D9X30_3746 [Cupriavidus sp. U2]|uniref:hypothetical protein n=1 Tax=Cupriavidus sp. U2 TaxID=2920269 RepID=UPI00129DB2B6|nr:hypothetical protein [Cupriavidus sp. U2]KAI3591065.1 hypothetical protein D9X30_3746 [Cupriavidus sp. U2]